MIFLYCGDSLDEHAQTYHDFWDWPLEGLRPPRPAWSFVERRGHMAGRLLLNANVKIGVGVENCESYKHIDPSKTVASRR